VFDEDEPRLGAVDIQRTATDLVRSSYKGRRTSYREQRTALNDSQGRHQGRAAVDNVKTRSLTNSLQILASYTGARTN